MPIAFAASLVLASSVSAGIAGAEDWLGLPEAWRAAGAFGTAPASGGWSEDFESGFELGNLPQNGWTSAFSPRAIIGDIWPIQGDRSLLYMADSSGFTEFSLRSPEFTNDYGRLTATVMRGSFRSKVQFITGDTQLNNFNTRISLETDGRITVGQLAEGGDSFEFIDTGVFYQLFVPLEIGVETDVFGNLRVTIDGEVVFEGYDTSYLLLGKPGRIGEWLMWTDNQTTGRPDGRGDTTTWDEFRFEPAPPFPAPGGLALGGMALAVATRRRR